MSTERSVSRRGFLRTAAGAGGLLGATGTSAAAEQTGTSTGTGGTGTPTGTGGGNQTAGTGTTTGGGAGGETHTVDMTDGLVYEPDEITIAPGDTVEWVNVGEIGHTVTAYQDEIPEGATYFASGGFDSEEAARNDAAAGNIPGGESYSHTFQTTGTFGYFCIPHEASGMTGTVTVQEPGTGPTATPPIIPEGAKSLAVATTGALFGTLVLGYLFLKYGGATPDSTE